MRDVNRHKHSGLLCTKSRGNEIIHDGHLCEGADVTAPIGRNFLLWWRCGKGDVPANKGYEGDIKEVTCPDCLELWEQEHGQFGVGT